MRQIFGVLILMCFMAASGVISPAAAQGQFWLQVESQRSIKDTRDRAQFFAGKFADTKAFLTTTGWYAIVIGPMTETEANDTLSRLTSAGQIPGDSIVTDGGAHISQLWPLTASTDTATTGDQTQPATTETVQAEPEPTFKPDPDIAASRALERSWSREDRMQYQIYMVWTGDYDKGIDGAYGPGTRSAIKLFQERNGFEQTGIISQEQADLLLARFNAAQERLGVTKVRDLDAGIEILMPGNFVAFSKFEPPFVHYGSKNGGKTRVMLISQEADRDNLTGLYDIMEAADYVPAEGYRVKKSDWFVLSGRDDKIVSYTYAKLDKGILKGFTLIWTPDLDRDMVPFATAMYESFTTIADYVLDDTMGVDTGEDGPLDLSSGLETATPEYSASGFFVNGQGALITHITTIEQCKKITINNGEVELEVVARDPALGLAVLKPKSAYQPESFAQFSTETPENGVEVSVAGFSFPEVMQVAALNFGTLADIPEAGQTLGEIGVTAYLEDGDLGGPVLDDRGAVLAAQIKRNGVGGVLPSSDNTAVTAGLITGFLSRNLVEFGNTTSLNSLAPEDVADMAAGFTVKVSCWK